MKTTAASSEENIWQLQITAATDKFADAANHLGVRKEALVGWDHHDEFEAPEPPGEFISVYFPHGEWKYPGKYASDFQPVNAAGYVWNFRVKTNLSAPRVTLDIKNIETLPSHFEAVLIDFQRGRKLNLSQQTNYNYQTQTESEDFQLIIGTNDFLQSEKTSLPEHFALLQNYPNPFNAQTKIEYSLPKGRPAELVIYNSLGEKIKSLVHRENLPAGRHTVTWNGTNQQGESVATGIYFLKFRIGANEFLQTRKLVLIK